MCVLCNITYSDAGERPRLAQSRIDVCDMYALLLGRITPSRYVMECSRAFTNSLDFVSTQYLFPVLADLSSQVGRTCNVVHCSRYVTLMV